MLHYIPTNWTFSIGQTKHPIEKFQFPSIHNDIKISGTQNHKLPVILSILKKHLNSQSNSFKLLRSESNKNENKFEERERMDLNVGSQKRELQGPAELDAGGDGATENKSRQTTILFLSG